METWFLTLVSLICISFLSLKSILKYLNNTLKYNQNQLPPGRYAFSMILKFHLHRESCTLLEPILQKLHAKLGPIVTLYFGLKTAIFIADGSLAHQALIQNGAVFADRPPPFPTSKIISSNQHNITAAFYGPTWRLFRRNLTSGVLHPSRFKSYSRSRNWVLATLVNRLNSLSQDSEPVLQVVDHFQYAMFSLFTLMCFGEKLEEKQLKNIEHVQRRLLLDFGPGRFNLINVLPRWMRINLFGIKKQWDELLQLRKDQESLFIPLINKRKKVQQEKLILDEKDDEFVLSYVDTLFDLQLPEEGKRELNEGEIVSLCSEFINAGTDTTSAALQWIVANIVKYPSIQKRLVEEIKGVIGIEEEEVKEEDLEKLPYLKAVILEGLRRHPPGQLVLPHAVTEDTVLGGYLVPKYAYVNFMAAAIGWDPKVWENPMEFKPERFMEEGVVDITGSREVKMMPFGVGRRICPGLGLALLHLEYFISNLVWKFEWKAIDRDEVDLSEKPEFTVVMKNPLKVFLSPRSLVVE